MRRFKRFLLIVAALLVGLGVYAAWAARPHDPGAPVRVTVTPLPSEAPWAVDSVFIETQRGPNLDCLVRRPAADTGRRLPAALLSGGFRTGKRAALVVGNAFHGVAMACSYPWRNPDSYSVPRLVLRLPKLRSELVSTPLTHRTAATYLLSRADVDSARFTGIGVSLGVPTIAAWAAEDQRVKAVALLYGGARLDRMIDRAAERGRWPAAARRPLAPLIGRALAPVEPARTVPRIAPRPLFIAIAPDDERIPRVSSEALAAAAGPQATVLRLGGAHVTPRAEDLLAMLTDSTMAWLARTLEPPR